MSDLISRQAAIDAICGKCREKCIPCEVYPCDEVIALQQVQAAETEIIRCKDCKWWDQKFDGSPMGYCMAAKHNYYSSHWEINIQRTYGLNFFCADAEPKEDEENDDQ